MTAPAGAVAFLAVDLGAQSGRVMAGILDRDAFTLDEVHRFANTPIVVDGTLCWDAPHLFDQTLDGIAAGIEFAHAHGAEVRGIGVDSWGVDYGLVDRDGQLIAPMRHYRAADAQTMAMALERLGRNVAYSRTGIIELPINTCFQLHRDAGLGLLDGPATMLLTPDLWTAWLCGDRGAERSIASTTGLVDRRTGAWADEVTTALSIPNRVLPALKDAGTIAGETTAEVTARVGARHPIPVIRTLGHDTASAFAAVADPGDGRAVVSCGTWALVGCATPGPVLTERAHRLGFTNEEGAGGSTVLIRNLSGTWLLEECLAEWREGTTVGELRTALLAQAAELPPSRTVIDVGAVELLEPGDMPQRIAALHARTSRGDRGLSAAETVRLIIDSLAAAFADTVAQAGRLTGTRPREIHMIGGGSNIGLLVSRTAEASGLPVVVGHPEATSLGNICVQAVASGMMPTIAAARARFAMPEEGPR